MSKIFKKTRRYIALILIACFTLTFTSCYTVPVTGRKAFILIDEQTEIKLGMDVYDEIKRTTKISHEPAVNSVVTRVGTRIATVSDFPHYNWEFTVFDKPDTVNAFCLPGGKVGVYTGILEVTQNEAGLATVIAHEAGHAVAKHGAERVSQGLMVALGEVALEEATKNKAKSDREKLKVAYGLGSTLFVLLPHSRRQELEADRIGLVYMAKAGYDPREAIALWERFSAYHKEKGDAHIAFLSTHPTDEKRIEQMKYFLPEAMYYYEQAVGQPTTVPRPGLEGAQIIRPTEKGKKKTFIGVKIPR